MRSVEEMESMGDEVTAILSGLQCSESCHSSRPAGTVENSPAFQGRGGVPRRISVPEGRLKLAVVDALFQPCLRHGFLISLSGSRQ